MTSEHPSVFVELQSRLTDLFKSSPAADLERNLRALVSQTFQRMDLITREEFEIQRALLEQLRGRVDHLEQQLAERDRGAGR